VRHRLPYASVIVVEAPDEADIVGYHDIVAEFAVTLDRAEFPDVNIVPYDHLPRGINDRSNSQVKAGSDADILANPVWAINQLERPPKCHREYKRWFRPGDYALSLRGLVFPRCFDHANSFRRDRSLLLGT